MKRYMPGLRSDAANPIEPLEGIFLVQVERAFYRYHPQKPFLTLQLTVLEPLQLAGKTFAGRLYCSPKALWKVRWFLRDFGYDEDLMGRDLVDEKALLGLRGMVRVSEIILKGNCFLNLDGFAPADSWQQSSLGTNRSNGAEAVPEGITEAIPEGINDL